MSKLPKLIRPMLASLRHGLPDDEDSYGWELKWDGLRAVAYVGDGTVRPEEGLIRAAPVQIYVFDLLQHGGARPQRPSRPYPAVAPRRDGRRAG
jgi:hypothetical protein